MIKEEIGNRLGVALSHGQIALVLTQIGQYSEAFHLYLLALAALAEMQSPQAQTAANALKALRGKWGEEHFDAAWREATGEGVPDWLK